MEFLDFLAKDFNWGIAVVFVVSGALLFLWPQIQNRFSPATGVSTLEAIKLMNAGSTIVLDVRDAASYAEGHLGKAINIPLAELREKLQELRKRSAKNILVYCDRGQKSLLAAKILVGTDKSIHNLKGGFIGWKDAALPVEKKAEKSSEKSSKKSSEKSNGKSKK